MGGTRKPSAKPASLKLTMAFHWLTVVLNSRISFYTKINYTRGKKVVDVVVMFHSYLRLSSADCLIYDWKRLDI